MAKFEFIVAKPCPYCGHELRPMFSTLGKGIVCFAHEQSDCFISGHSIGVVLIPKFNRRADEGATQNRVVEART